MFRTRCRKPQAIELMRKLAGLFLTSSLLFSLTVTVQIRANVQKTPPDKNAAAAQEKRREALQLLDEIIVNASLIKPLEYDILTRIEGAIILWRFDKPRATEIIKEAAKLMRERIEEEQRQRETAKREDPKWKKYKFLLIRKIGTISPELAQELALAGVSEEQKSTWFTDDEWTGEARAILSVAHDLLEKDAKQAARMAELAIPLGKLVFSGFLEQLSQRDSAEAERLAIMVISRYRDTPINPLFFLNMRRYVLAENRSARLQEHFYQAVAARLRRDLRPNLHQRDLEDAISTSRQMAQTAARRAPHWQPEFQMLSNEFEALYRTGAYAALPTPVTRVIDTSVLDPATEGDTATISEALPSVEALRDARRRDKEYQELAVQAAMKANARLAEELLAKISDERTRQEAAVAVYTPLVKKATADGQWALAQSFARKVPDPLMRVLTYEVIARAATKLPREKHRVREAYKQALASLEGIEADERVVRGTLFLAKTTFAVQAELGLEALRAAVEGLNHLHRKTTFVEEAPLSQMTYHLLLFPHPMLQLDEIFDLNEMLGAAFTQLAQRDLQESKYQAVNLNHWGMRSLAQLAICRVLLAEKPVEKLSDKPKAPLKPAAPSRQPAKTA